MKNPGYNSELFPHWCNLQVRYRDLDTLNHVNNAIFNTFFEEARIRFIQQIPEFQQSMKEGNSFVLVNLEVKYIKPIFYPSEILAGTGIESYGNSSITGFQAIYDTDTKELKATAKSTGVWYSINQKRPVKLPALPDKKKFLVKTSE